MLGSALLIHVGTGGTTQVGRLLALKPVVFVGLISYSLYLWHWPVPAFLRQMQGSVDLDPLKVVLALVLMFAGAILSWRFVERPFRNRQKIRRRSIFALSAVEGALAVQGKGAWPAIHGACPPLLGIRRLDAETWRSCIAFNEVVIAMLEQDRGEIDTVILVGR